VVATAAGMVLDVVDRAALLFAGQVRLGDRSGQPVFGDPSAVAQWLL
jgi:hypothetical protein